jgi:hypothetical protein
MNNISWSKTIGNWAKNDQNFDPNAPVAESKERIVMSPEDLLNAKNSLLEKCDELIVMSSTLYDCSSSKELYDTIVTLNSAKRSLDRIFVKESKK